MEVNPIKSTLALHFPHRIFVGSLTRETTPAEIAEFFKNYGVVIESKVIMDSAGCSKGFGFVSFDSKEAVAKVLKQGTIYLKGRKITIAPAVKKHNVQDSIPSDVKLTKYFTNKGTVKDIGFTNIRWHSTVPQHQQQQSQQVMQPPVVQHIQQPVGLMNQPYHTILPGSYNYPSMVPHLAVPANLTSPSQGNWVAPYVFIC